MDTAADGSLNRHGGSASGLETAADEAARERAEAVEERMTDLLMWADMRCPECGELMSHLDLDAHLATCELLRARAEAEVDRG